MRLVHVLCQIFGVATRAGKLWKVLIFNRSIFLTCKVFDNDSDLEKVMELSVDGHLFIKRHRKDTKKN